MGDSPHTLSRQRFSQVHGGVRYLEKAFSTISPTRAAGQLKLVFEALHERKRLLENAPHLCSALPIMTVSTHATNGALGLVLLGGHCLVSQSEQMHAVHASGVLVKLHEGAHKKS